MTTTKSEDQSAVATNVEVLGEVMNSETEMIRISRHEFRGKPYISMRLFFKNQAGEFRPTKKGLTITPEVFRKLADAVINASDAIARG